jgi:putative alpha-1,2-mannosidase
VTFEDGPVTAATAISHVDADGAAKNLGEARGKAFDELRAEAQEAWRRELSSVEVSAEGTDRTVFYTALYHVLLQPLTGNDVDGRYRGFDGQVHTADGWTYHEYFSLWDTYRAQNQLLALLRPARAKDIARSLLAIHEQGGWLPRWAYANQETNTMTGDPVTPFLVDLWRFGALEGLEERAYDALWQNATGVPPASSPFEGRAGNPSYLRNGFVQYDKGFRKKGQDVDPHHGASATLEYALADCSLWIMAQALGHHDDAEILRRRGLNYRVLTARGWRRSPRRARTASTRARRGSTSGWRSRTCPVWSDCSAAVPRRWPGWTTSSPTRTWWRTRRGPCARSGSSGPTATTTSSATTPTTSRTCTCRGCTRWWGSRGRRRPWCGRRRRCSSTRRTA